MNNSIIESLWISEVMDNMKIAEMKIRDENSGLIEYHSLVQLNNMPCFFVSDQSIQDLNNHALINYMNRYEARRFSGYEDFYCCYYHGYTDKEDPTMVVLCAVLLCEPRLQVSMMDEWAGKYLDEIHVPDTYAERQYKCRVCGACSDCLFEECTEEEFFAD